MGLRKSVDFSELPKNLKPEIAERVAKHFKDGAFEFDFSTEEMIAVEGNTVYHTIPHYAEGEARKAYWTSCAVSWREIWRKPNESC